MAAFVIGLALIDPVQAETAENFIARLDVQFRQLAAAPDNRRGRTIVVSAFDVAGIAQEATRPRWSFFSPEERSQIVDVLTGKFAEISIRERARMGHVSLAFAEQKLLSGGDVLISMRALAGGREHSASWRLRPAGNSFRIVDMWTERGALAATLRARFNNASKRENPVRAFVDQLRAL